MPDAVNRQELAAITHFTIGDIEALSKVFATTLVDLNQAAAKQAMGIVEVAAIAARVAHSIRSEEKRRVNGEATEEVTPVIEQLTQASADYRETARRSQDALSALASQSKSGHQSVGAPARPETAIGLIAEAVSDTIVNINQAMQNALANQQSLNEIASAAAAQGVALIYSVAGGQSKTQGA
jgi:hypothetical protein